MIRFGVVTFPGSNCDHDMFEALKLMKVTPEYVWHKTADLDDYDLIILKLLLNNSRLTTTELARKIGIPIPKVISKLERLKHLGIITRYTIDLKTNYIFDYPKFYHRLI